MGLPRLSNLEMQIMEILWKQGPSSAREILEKFPRKGRPAYTTVRTMLVRLEDKNALRRVRKAVTAHIFEATIPRQAARRRLIDNILAIFGGEPKTIMMHLVKTRRLSLEDIQEAENYIRESQKKGSSRSADYRSMK
jgi:BlaI family transcriptional regulator, penicillinase repressor